MIRLLGSRKFIGLPPGTLYTEHWLNDIEQCNTMIHNFIENPDEFLDTLDLFIYQDNGASLLLEGQKDEDDLCLTDVNVVGDASPGTTLRIVFNLEDLPDIITIRGSNYDDRVNWTKQEISEIIKEMKEDNHINKRHHNWALEELEKLHVKGNKIIDVEIVKQNLYRKE